MAKKLAIYGAGKAGEWLLDELLQKKPDVIVQGFLDAHAQQKQIRNVPVYRPEEYMKKYKDQTDMVVIAAGRQKAVCEMVKFLQRHQISNIYMLHDVPGKKHMPLLDKGEFLPQRIRKIRFSDSKPTLPYVELPITNECNLNCKGCLFLCNPAGDRTEVPVKTVIKDLVRMRELFEDIPWIRILGGEPLLHKELTEILRAARELFEDSEIDVCTNGLLLPRLAQDMYQMFRELRIVIHISGYEPVYRMQEEIESVLNQEEIPYCFLERSDFSKFYSLSDSNDGAYNFQNCFTSSCHELYQGKLAMCSGVIAFDKMNHQFRTEYQLQEGKDYFDIHKADLDVWNVMELLAKPIPACRYCNMAQMEDFPWAAVGNHAALEDYIVG